MKVLYMSFNGFYEYNGISKKKLAQIKGLKECGCNVVNCYYSIDPINGHSVWMVDESVLIDLGVGMIAKIKKRIDYSPILKYVNQRQISFVYIRSEHNASPFLINFAKQLKKRGVKVVMEIPTYPYDQEYTLARKFSLIIDILFRKRLAKNLDAIITFSDQPVIFGQRAIRISNGIDFSTTKLKQNNHQQFELHLIGVAEIHFWHGFDRVVAGLRDYYKSYDGRYKVFFHIVGEFSGEREKNEILPLIRDNGLEEYVILYGRLFGEDLDTMFDKADFAIGSLGRHRSGITYIKTLKNREYAARGVPFIYSEIDEDFEDKTYIMKAPADESPIDINQIIDFYRRVNNTSEEIRNSVQYLSWKNQIQRVLDSIDITIMKIKIAYCIPALYSPSGMERVLTLKANYLVDIFGYDVSIILTDGKEKPPYYKLSSRIHLINLDVNFDDLHGKSLYERVWGYIKKQYLFKKRLTQCLTELKPDITISTLRREINFINSIKDGSLKLGEIHFSRANYRDLKQEKISAFFQKLLGKLWMNQLIGKLKRLQCFIVLTHEDEALWAELKNKTVIPNPLSFYPEKSSNCSTKNVIAVGRYTYQKGFDLLLKAWINVRKSYPEWSLHIFGGGDRSYFLQLSKDLGISDVCFLEPAVLDIENKYQESSIIVLSSRYEGFGMVLIEAMACGVPPVSFACPCGPKDIIKNGEDGLLVESENIEMLAEKICYLIENEDIRIQLGRNARESAKRFSIDEIMFKWKDLFENLLNNKKITNE